MPIVSRTCSKENILFGLGKPIRSTGIIEKMVHVVRIIFHFVERIEIFSLKIFSVALICSHHDWYEQVYELVIIKTRRKRDRKILSTEGAENQKGNICSLIMLTSTEILDKRYLMPKWHNLFRRSIGLAYCSFQGLSCPTEFKWKKIGLYLSFKLNGKIKFALPHQMAEK